jgi:hypothetical protein
MVDRKRVRLEYVETGTKPPRLELVEKRRLIDYCSARRVDDNAVVGQ